MIYQIEEKIWEGKGTLKIKELFISGLMFAILE